MDIGEKFGMLTIVSDSGKKSKNRERIWECLCDCGTIKNIESKLLRRLDRPRSCGCSRKIPATKRFHSNYIKTEGCWEWTGTLNAGGYGKFRGSTSNRAAWIYSKGYIQKGMQVCHSCDNRKCVNPDHLFLGSISDNMADKVAKNRQAKGSKIHNSILTEEVVLSIRKDRISGLEYEELSKKYSVGWDNIRYICKNRLWKHVPLGEESSEVKRKY